MVNYTVLSLKPCIYYLYITCIVSIVLPLLSVLCLLTTELFFFFQINDRSLGSNIVVLVAAPKKAFDMS